MDAVQRGQASARQHGGANAFSSPGSGCALDGGCAHREAGRPPSQDQLSAASSGAFEDAGGVVQGCVTKSNIVPRMAVHRAHQRRRAARQSRRSTAGVTGLVHSTELALAPKGTVLAVAAGEKCRGRAAHRRAWPRRCRSCALASRKPAATSRPPRASLRRWRAGCRHATSSTRYSQNHCEGRIRRHPHVQARNSSAPMARPFRAPRPRQDGSRQLTQAKRLTIPINGSPRSDVSAGGGSLSACARTPLQPRRAAEGRVLLSCPRTRIAIGGMGATHLGDGLAQTGRRGRLADGRRSTSGQPCADPIDVQVATSLD